MIVFGIGLSKTGSSSLFAAMEKLGYESTKPIDMTEIDLPAEAATDPNCKHYINLTHLSHHYPEVVDRYPGAKYILTERDIETWLNSASRQFRNTPEPGSEAAERRIAKFGTLEYDPEKYTAAFKAHSAEVRERFKDRPDDLLVLRICDGEGFEQLCPFLGESNPETAAFPKENQSRSFERFVRKVRAMLGVPQKV